MSNLVKNEVQFSQLYSLLGQRCISAGDVDAIKYLYGNICYEQPPLIQTISVLQDCLTLNEIFNDTQNIYRNEFLYYWGMTCMGWTSRLIVKRLDMAKFCFEKIVKAVPKSNARLAYIDLLLSEEHYKRDNNIRRLGILREWAGKQDMFSKIALAKIVYYSFLNEKQSDNSGLPITAMRLLETPCQMGHPEAIKFYNEIMNNINGADEFILDKKIATSRININVLYDL